MVGSAIRTEGSTAERFLRSLEDLVPGDHACLVYDSEERRRDVLVSYLSRGLARGERVVYLAAGPADAVSRGLEELAAPGQLTVLESEDAYLDGGAFAPERALAGFRTALAETIDAGFPALRTGGGPPEAVTGGCAHELAPYERSAAPLFAGGRLVSLCAYDARAVPPASLLGIVDVHPVVLYALGEDERLRVDASGPTTLAPHGWIDVTTIGALVGALTRAVDAGESVSVDLSHVDFVDVAGLRLLAEAARALHAKGKLLTLASPPSPVPAVLTILGYDHTDGLVVQ